jgi:hypothetical protein
VCLCAADLKRLSSDGTDSGDEFDRMIPITAILCEVDWMEL